jgi:molybdopterin-biosynthesis enzyme MoeA-like protein
VAGFSINEHYFLPGFPQMAHPMMEWVLDTHYVSLFHQQDYIEASILVTEAGESRLIDLMQSIVKRYPDLKLFSLPKLDQQRSTELGVKGPALMVQTAMAEIKQGVSALNFPWTDL